MSTLYTSNLHLFCVIAGLLTLLEVVFYPSSIFENIFVFQCKLLSLFNVVSSSLFLFNIFTNTYVITSRSTNQSSCD